MSQSNIDRSPTYACRTCEKTQCGCKDVESPLPCHFYAKPVKQKPVLCVECGQPTMHMGNKCYSCCQKATRGLEDALKAAAPVRTKDLTDEIDRLCAAIKAEDDYCVDNGNYMLDSNDCIKIIRGEWVRPDYSLDRAVIAADREKNK